MPRKLGIDASIVPGRIRKEPCDYSILTKLFGQGLVRDRLTEAVYDLDR